MLLRWRTRPKAGSCCVIVSASRSSRRVRSCAFSPGRSSLTAARAASLAGPRASRPAHFLVAAKKMRAWRPAVRQETLGQFLQRLVAQAELAQMSHGVLQIVEVAAGRATAAAQQ